ncbi:MAG: hypothetical protein FWF49_04025 [Oscillospiraceae bacterium]|nr:hypothetical protein [Oscillospiraceae bacterium]
MAEWDKSADSSAGEELSAEQILEQILSAKAAGGEAPPDTDMDTPADRSGAGTPGKGKTAGNMTVDEVLALFNTPGTAAVAAAPTDAVDEKAMPVIDEPMAGTVPPAAFSDETEDAATVVFVEEEVDFSVTEMIFPEKIADENIVDTVTAAPEETPADESIADDFIVEKIFTGESAAYEISTDESFVAAAPEEKSSVDEPSPPVNPAPGRLADRDAATRMVRLIDDEAPGDDDGQMSLFEEQDREAEEKLKDWEAHFEESRQKRVRAFHLFSTRKPRMTEEIDKTLLPPKGADAADGGSAPQDLSTTGDRIAGDRVAGNDMAGTAAAAFPGDFADGTGGTNGVFTSFLPDDWELPPEEYEDIADAPSIGGELARRCRRALVTLGVCAGLEALLILAAALLAAGLNAALSVTAQVLLLVTLLVMNRDWLLPGLTGIFRRRPTGASLAAMTGVLTLVYTLLLYFALPQAGWSFAPVAGLSLLLGAAGRVSHHARVRRNFAALTRPGDLYAARIIEDDKTAVDIGKGAVALGVPNVAYFCKTDFLHRFLAQSDAEDSGRFGVVFLPLLGGVSVLIALFALLFGLPLMAAVGTGVAALCAAAPAAVLAASTLPLSAAAREARKTGGMLVGWNAAQAFGDVHGFVVDAAQLFPDEAMLLHSVKTFSGARIDETLIDAASLSIAAGGPLAAVFRRIIGGDESLLLPVDSLLYEQDMGLSGWVDGRRVLIGNRTLLENHGVHVPSRDFEEKYAVGGRRLTYLSAAGELAAMFVMSYQPTEDVTDAVRLLQKGGVTVLVHTTDPHVTEAMVCETLRVDPYYLEILDAGPGRAYEALLEEGKEQRFVALLASDGSLTGMAEGLHACRRARSGVAIAMIAQIVCGIAGLSLAAVVALVSRAPLSPLYAALFSVASAALACGLPKLKR